MDQDKKDTESSSRGSTYQADYYIIKPTHRESYTVADRLEAFTPKNSSPEYKEALKKLHQDWQRESKNGKNTP
jgi:hypothetical protein